MNCKGHADDVAHVARKHYFHLYNATGDGWECVEAEIKRTDHFSRIARIPSWIVVADFAIRLAAFRKTDSFGRAPRRTERLRKLSVYYNSLIEIVGVYVDVKIFC